MDSRSDPERARLSQRLAGIQSLDPTFDGT